ncbi:Uncharacterised protein [Mycobacterium tuberculosis]|nr:Uncharacterised protein [Mycobacterium tuberculosis]
MVALVRSILTLTAAQSHPSPSSERVPTRTRARPARKYSVASATHVRGVKPPVPRMTRRLGWASSGSAVTSAPRSAQKAIRSSSIAAGQAKV